jgi:hypothetical protein
MEATVHKFIINLGDHGDVEGEFKILESDDNKTSNYIDSLCLSQLL